MHMYDHAPSCTRCLYIYVHVINACLVHGIVLCISVNIYSRTSDLIVDPPR